MGLFFLIAGTSLVVYCYVLSIQIDKRFKGRRWRIPSKVLSDATLLYQGQNINRDLFEQKLFRLGYKKVASIPKQKGDVRIEKQAIDIFLNDLIIPSGNRTGFRVQLQLTHNYLKGMVRMDTGESLAILELEPEEIMLFFGPDREKRQLISIDQVPRHLKYAVLAAEDRRFYQHRGIDPIGIFRAAFTNLRHGKIKQGGSSITQQLVKNYFLTSQRTFLRKIKELLMALTMETIYTKDEILEIYMNEIYLGQKKSVSINGFGEASMFYFGKKVSDLNVHEAATIAGLIKAPNKYSPYVNSQICLKRRNYVITAMKENGWISQEEYELSINESIETAGLKISGRNAPYFIDYLYKQLKALYTKEALSSQGLKIYTTLDTQVQQAAEIALKSGLLRLEKIDPRLKRIKPEERLQGCVIVIQPKTGAILAMIGGRNYNVSQFNRATQALRQPGSTIKPFVYLSALDIYTPASILSNVPKTYLIDEKPWKPKNYSFIEDSRINLRNALARSVNLATVDLAMKIGLDRIIQTIQKFKFSTPSKSYPSLALGAFEVIPLEIAGAYCVFAADGVKPYLLSLKEVVSEGGQILEQKHMTIENVITPAKAFIMSSMLKSVVDKGTARHLKKMGIDFTVGGKTGTTNHFKDAWFIGYTPDILSLVWVGFDNGDSLHHSGSEVALPIWATLMNNIPQYVSGTWFRKPPGVVIRKVCSDSGELAVIRSCPSTVLEYFLLENEPRNTCPLHSGENH